MRFVLLVAVVIVLAVPAVAGSTYEADGTLEPGTPLYGGAAFYDFLAGPGDVVDVEVSWDDGAGPISAAIHDGRLVDDCISLGLPFCDAGSDERALLRAENGEACGLDYQGFAKASPVRLHAVVPPGSGDNFGFWIEIRSVASATPIPFHVSLQVDGQAPFITSTWHGSDVNFQPFCQAHALLRDP